MTYIRNQTMSILPLSELKCSLRVDIIDMRVSRFNLSALYWTLPVDGRIKTTILNGQARGTILKKKKGDSKEYSSFNNALNLNVSSPDISYRVASVKISKKSIHITGLQTKEQVEEIAEFIVKTLKETQADFQKILDDGLEDSNKELTESAKYFIEKNMQDFRPEIAAAILRVILRKMKEENFSYLYQEDKEPDLSVGDHTQIMENFPFRLPNKINVHIFPEVYMNSKYFEVNHSDASTSKIIIKREVKTPKGSKNVTFSCYASGAVTMSGPNRKCMEHVYNSFIATYLKNKQDIDVEMDKVVEQVKLREDNQEIKVYSKNKVEEISKNRLEYVKSLENGEIPIYVSDSEGDLPISSSSEEM